MPVILSIIQPYSNSFIHSKDHLPRALQNLFTTAYLEADFTHLTTLAESYMHDDVTPAMVDHLAVLAQDQAKSRNWFKYRPGQNHIFPLQAGPVSYTHLTLPTKRIV